MQKYKCLCFEKHFSNTLPINVAIVEWKLILILEGNKNVNNSQFLIKFRFSLRCECK